MGAGSWSIIHEECDGKHSKSLNLCEVTRPRSVLLWNYKLNSANNKKTSIFQDPVFQRQFIKIQITSQIFIVKGLNTDSMLVQ
jgi:hypothetical protein